MNSIIFLFFVISFYPILSTSITLINDTAQPICLSNHKTFILHLAPQAHHIFSQPVPLTLCIYTQNKPGEFQFFGKLIELEITHAPITLTTSQILNQTITNIFPHLFTFETHLHGSTNKKTEVPIVHGSALNPQTVQSILQTLDALPNRQNTNTDPYLNNPLAALLAARHTAQKKSITHSTKK